MNKNENTKILETENKNLNTESNKPNLIAEKHNPLVKLSIEKDDKKQNFNTNTFKNDNLYINPDDADLVNNSIKNLNNEKKIISKQVEVITKIVYTYEDGSTREVTEKNNHTYHFD